MTAITEKPKQKDKAALEKVIRARTNLLISNGFFGFLALQLKVVEAEMIGSFENKTMAVDGFTLFYNPEFVHAMTDREVEGVVAHEVMHCCFQHFARRQNRIPQIWNMATDHVINLDLQASGFSLPNLVDMKGKDGKPMFPNCIGICADPKFKGMNAEAVYDELMKNVTVIQLQIGNNSDPGGCGATIDAPDGANGEAEAKNSWEQAVRSAVATAKANNAGNVPGSLAQLIKELNAPKVSWRELTRRWIDQSMSKDYSWARISRRSLSIGTLLPGMVSDRLNHLVFFVDISGSTFELCKEMVSECAGALDQGTCDHMTIVYADTEVRHVDEYHAGDLVETGKYEGGGTDFRDSFKWLADNAPDASCCIYLTDLQVNEFGEDPGIPTLWAVYGPDQDYDSLAERVPFGSCVHISNTYG